VYFRDYRVLANGQGLKDLSSRLKNLLIFTKFCPATTWVVRYPVPQRGQFAFYLLTDAGVFTASAPEEELRRHRNPLYKLGDAAQTIITVSNSQ
jgi:hypothetical protein